MRGFCPWKMYDEHVITSFAESAIIKQQITRRKLRALQVNSVQLYKEHHAHSHIMEFQVSCPSLSQLSQVRTGARSFAWSTRGQVMALNVWGVRCFLTTGFLLLWIWHYVTSLRIICRLQDLDSEGFQKDGTSLGSGGWTCTTPLSLFV